MKPRLLLWCAAGLPIAGVLCLAILAPSEYESRDGFVVQHLNLGVPLYGLLLLPVVTAALSSGYRSAHALAKVLAVLQLFAFVAVALWTTYAIAKLSELPTSFRLLATTATTAMVGIPALLTAAAIRLTRSQGTRRA